jgi:hypothetical protein
MRAVREGGRGERFVYLDSVANGRIRLRVERFRPSDPLCCPSLGGWTEYVFRNGVLLEVPKRERPNPSAKIEKPLPGLPGAGEAKTNGAAQVPQK